MTHSLPISQMPPVYRLHALVLALCSPTLVGVAILSALAGLQMLPQQPDPTWQPDAAIGVGSTVVGAVWMLIISWGFFGTAYGPLLLPIAAAIVAIARRRGTTRTALLWLYLALGVAAAAIGWGWTLDAVELP